MAAERGVTSVLLADARDCIARIDDLLAQPELTEASFNGYVEQNGRFHALLSEMAGSDLVARQLDRAKTLPFASPNGFVCLAPRPEQRHHGGGARSSKRIGNRAARRRRPKP